MQVQPNLGQNLLGLGGANANPPNLIIPEGNSQGYFTIWTAGNAGVNGCNPFFKNGVQYQVTAGKTFKVSAIVYMAATANIQFQLIHSLTAFARAAAGPIAGQVSQMGAAGVYGIVTGGVGVMQTVAMQYDFPALAYPGAQFAVNDVFCIGLVGKEV